MSGKARSKTAGVTRKEIRLDFNNLRETAYLGVRRAAAFLGIGLNTTEEYIPQSLALTTRLIALSQARPYVAAPPRSKPDFGPWFGRWPSRLGAFPSLFFDAVGRA